jgi:alpha-D-xyloside xylohydrolase
MSKRRGVLGVSSALPRQLALALLVGVAAGNAMGCSTGRSDGSDPSDPGPSASLDRAGYSLQFEAERARLALRLADRELVTLPMDALAIVTVAKVDDAVNYDPWPLVTESLAWTPPQDLRVRRARNARLLEATADRMRLALEFEGGLSGTLDVRAAADGRFSATLRADDPGSVAMYRAGVDVLESEGLYGMGESFDDVEQRGKLRAMQLEVDELESANNEAHVPIPLLVGTRGWGLFVESSFPGAFDVARTSPTRAEATYGTGLASNRGLTFHLLGAEHPLDVTRRYYELTGFPKLPAPWATGPLVWRDENEDQAQLEADLETMRALDLPVSGVWIDRPYATAVNTFDFDPAKFPEPRALVEKAHALGYRIGLWHTPYLDEESTATASLRAEAEEKGYLPLEVGLLLNGWGKPIDFTSPGAMDWWRGLLEPYARLGFEGYKLDYAEDVVPGVFGARNVYRFHDASDERTMHRGYTLDYHETYAAMLPEDGGMLLCRAGKWGSQTLGPIIWPGDLDARMWRHREVVEEKGETIRAVGGLHAAMVASVSLGPSGFPFFGSDTGGYRHAPPDKETFRRWFEHTALTSVMQIGTSTNDVAWEFDDPELLASYRSYTRLHLRLFPYTWTLARAIGRTGTPIQRPFGLAEPEAGVHPSDQYFYGDALLVAPVTDPGVVARDVAFPVGRWVSFWDGGVYNGFGTANVPAPLGTLPLFLRAGAFVPMLRPTIDTLAPTSVPELVDSFATRAGPIHALMAPWTSSAQEVGAYQGQSSELELYDGTRLEYLESGTSLELRVAPGTTFDEGAVFELISFGAAPVAVRVDGDLLSLVAAGRPTPADPSYSFEPEARGGSLVVAVRPGTHRVTIERAP